MEQEQEAFAISYHDCTKLNGNSKSANRSGEHFFQAGCFVSATIQQLSTQLSNQQTQVTIQKLVKQKEDTERNLNQKVRVIFHFISHSQKANKSVSIVSLPGLLF